MLVLSPCPSVPAWHPPTPFFLHCAPPTSCASCPLPPPGGSMMWAPHISLMTPQPVCDHFPWDIWPWVLHPHRGCHPPGISCLSPSFLCSQPCAVAATPCCCSGTSALAPHCSCSSCPSPASLSSILPAPRQPMGWLVPKPQLSSFLREPA